MSYDIFWYDDAERDLAKLDNDIAERVVKKVESAAAHPFHYLDMLKGSPYYKLRIGDYRAIIDIAKDDETLTVILVGHRKKVYKQLDRK